MDRVEWMQALADEDEKPPEPKKPLERFHNKHRLNISQDGFCNIKCMRCGIEGRTYLTPFEEECTKANFVGCHGYHV